MMPVASNSIYPVAQIDQAAEPWIQKYDAVYNDLNTIFEHGLYSRLKKELDSVDPFLQEGQALNHSPLIADRLSALQKLYIQAKQKMGANPEQLTNDTHLEDKWNALGFSEPVTDALLGRHADCVRFLYESKLIFSIVGFRETCGHDHDHCIRFASDGHPLLKVKGEWMRWETLNREVEYNKLSEKIQSRAYPGNIVQGWSYFHPQGLVPIDRFNYERAFLIYELSEGEYTRARQFALKFYETNPERNCGVAKNCILQIFTSPRKHFPTGSDALDTLIENAEAQYPMHVSMRLITADRKVYSFGMQTFPEADKFIKSNLLSHFMTTVPGKVAMIDMEEFREHEGRVTTYIPVSSQAANNILNLIDELHPHELRFQFARQNCSNMMLEVLKKAGYTIDISTDGPEFVYEMLPNLDQFPLIGPLIAKVEECIQFPKMPTFIAKTYTWVKEGLLFVPKKIAIFLSNLLFWKLGAGKKTTPLEEGVQEEELYDKNGLQNFSSVIRSWSDLFKESTSRIYNAKYVLEWQKKQHSTLIEPYTGRPKLFIVPPA